MSLGQWGGWVELGAIIYLTTLTPRSAGRLCCHPEFLSHIRHLISFFLPRCPIYGAAIVRRASDVRMKPRAAIYDFTTEPRPTLFEDAESFNSSLRHLDWAGRASPIRLLVVLEGLSPDWTAPLQEHLQVPPSVISLHKKWPSDHAAGNCRVALGESPNRHAILRYRQPLPFRVKEKQKGMVALTRSLPSSLMAATTNQRRLPILLLRCARSSRRHPNH